MHLATTTQTRMGKRGGFEITPKVQLRMKAALSKFWVLTTVESPLRQRRFLDLAAANTGSAHANALAGAFHYRMYALKIQVPATLRHVMGVADTVAELRATAADFTHFCHTNKLLPDNEPSPINNQSSKPRRGVQRFGELLPRLRVAMIPHASARFRLNPDWLRLHHTGNVTVLPQLWQMGT